MTQLVAPGVCQDIRVGRAATAVPHLVTARGREALGAKLSAARSPDCRPARRRARRLFNLTAMRIRTALASRAECDPQRASLANRYPYEEAGALRTAIARLHGVQPSQVIIGCGSGEILRMAMQAFTSRTRYLVTAAPTFEAPGEYADAFGVPIRAVRVGANLSLNLADDGARGERRGAGVHLQSAQPDGHRAQRIRR